MPARDGIWAHNEECLFPVRPNPSHQDPEQPVGSGQSRPRVLSLQCQDLLAESQIFKEKPMTRGEETQDNACQEPSGIYHGSVLSHLTCGQQPSILLKSGRTEFWRTTGHTSNCFRSQLHSD